MRTITGLSGTPLDLPGFDITHPGEPDEVLTLFAKVPLQSVPGTSWQYSSIGYLLAARVIEAVSGTR